MKVYRRVIPTTWTFNNCHWLNLIVKREREIISPTYRHLQKLILKCFFEYGFLDLHISGMKTSWMLLRIKELLTAYISGDISYSRISEYIFGQYLIYVYTHILKRFYPNWRWTLRKQVFRNSLGRSYELIANTWWTCDTEL